MITTLRYCDTDNDGHFGKVTLLRDDNQRIVFPVCTCGHSDESMAAVLAMIEAHPLASVSVDPRTWRATPSDDEWPTPPD